MKYSEREELYFSFLDNLRDSGVTNMFGASPYLEAEFALESKEARDVLAKWMKSFKEEPEEEPVAEESVVEEEPVAEETEESTEDHSDEATRFETCPELSPAEYTTYAYHEKDADYYKVDRYTAKRVYFSEDSNKKFAPKTSIGHYNVTGLKSE